MSAEEIVSQLMQAISGLTRAVGNLEGVTAAINERLAKGDAQFAKHSSEIEKFKLVLAKVHGGWWMLTVQAAVFGIVAGLVIKFFNK
jgi:hypothetical protein